MSGIVKFHRSASSLYQRQATGRLHLFRGDRQWIFHFHRGRIAWAEGGIHRVRRWRRALYDIQDNLSLKWCFERIGTDIGTFWEYEWLDREVRDRSLGIRAARKGIQSIAREMIFAATYEEDIKSRWEPGLFPQVNPDLSLPGGAIVQAIRDASTFQQQWQKLQLQEEAIDCGLLLSAQEQISQQHRSNTFLSFKSLLNGQRTFWDITQKLDRSSSILGRILQHFIQQQIIDFKPLSDLPSPKMFWAKHQDLKTVACVDSDRDSCLALEHTLVDAGYRCITIADPLKVVPTLFKMQPDLILIDANLPLVNGYEVCAQLRRVESLVEIPVIILGDREGLVDRIRTRLVRASTFLAKPFSPEALLAVVERSLAEDKAF